MSKAEETGREPRPVNYDESLVPEYRLPDLLERPDGSRVESAFEWANGQRRYWLELLAAELYGPVPPRPDFMRIEVIAEKPDALGGLALRREVRLHFANAAGVERVLDLLVYLPNDAAGPVPVQIALNFRGNHTVTPETDLPLPRHWLLGRTDNRGREEDRGSMIRRWDPETTVRRGYALVTACYTQIHPDHAGGGGDGIYALFPQFEGRPAISAWAWGLSRLMDYVETEPAIDASRTLLTGHSRLGKAALWAGACDPRFRVVVSNNSGCGGAALSRRMFGETFESMIFDNAMGHWFSRNLEQYADRAGEMPFDQHVLLALIAPRPLYVTSASEDLWADPRGEFLALKAAEPVYRLFGAAGLPADVMPEPGQTLRGACAYHCREGEHDLVAFDRDNFFDFADHYFK